MSTLFPKTISYISFTANGTEGTTDAAGDYIPGDQETLTFEGSVQPATGKDIDSLPVGRRDKGMVKVYSSIQLVVSKQGGKSAGDVVLWREQKWEIVSEGINENSLIPHYKYMGQYVGEVE